MSEQWVQPPLPEFEDLARMQRTYPEPTTLDALREDIRALGRQVAEILYLLERRL